MNGLRRKDDEEKTTAGIRKKLKIKKVKTTVEIAVGIINSTPV